MPLSKISRAFIIAAAGVSLAGCFDQSTALVLFPHSPLVTITDVDLRSGQDDESAVVARLAKGTVVNPIGQAGSECNSCVRVDTPEGVGWLYTRYVATVPASE
jgi:hypothetical protein